MEGTILITGGAGFLGEHLARALVLRGERVVAYDNLPTGFSEKFAAFDERITFVQGGYTRQRCRFAQSSWWEPKPTRRTTGAEFLSRSSPPKMN